jgi:ADP-heptose:LPS heptosyltransferase
LRYGEAALLYEQYLLKAPKDSAIHVQCGHMYKEAGQFDQAEYHYDCATRLTPNDPGLALQLGHFFKVAGRPTDSERAYRRALELAPDWNEPIFELSQMPKTGMHVLNPFPAAAEGRAAGNDTSPADTDWKQAAADGLLLPDLAPGPHDDMLRSYQEEVRVVRFGHWELTKSGFANVVRGIEAIRGYCISAVPIREVQLRLGGKSLHVGTAQGHPLRFERTTSKRMKYVFNAWFDFTAIREGAYEAEIRLIGEDKSRRVHKRKVVVGAPLREADYPRSDRLVEADPNDRRSLEEQINSRPSALRPARRAYFATPPRSVLIQRIDQLGDMVVSVPAMRRMRELLPDSRLVALVASSNAELTRSLGIFDDIVTADFPADEVLQRRVMPLNEQDALRRQLAAFNFDVAIDFSESPVTRPLLLLSGARLLFGFRDRTLPWLSADYSVHSPDPRSGLDQISPSVKLLGLADWFGRLLRSPARTTRRDDLTRDRLAPYGLSRNDRFAVLHTGARLKFSRWPHFGSLASMILAGTDLKIVMMADEPVPRSELPSEIAQSDRFQVLDRRLPFDDLDALLSFCSVFVGNDTGPGHLASLRGAEVITLYCARLNWSEWGPENNGYIFSRRVPCAGCAIHHEPEECGKDYACVTNIRPDEVFRTVQEILGKEQGGP